MANPPISYEVQRQAAERELKLRLRVYPRRVAAGQMTANLARHETAAMEAIVETLRGLEAGKE